MAFNLEEFRSQVRQEFLAECTVDERLRGLAAEERVRGLAAEERIRGLSQNEILSMSDQTRRHLLSLLLTADTKRSEH